MTRRATVSTIVLVALSSLLTQPSCAGEAGFLIKGMQYLWKGFAPATKRAVSEEATALAARSAAKTKAAASVQQAAKSESSGTSGAHDLVEHGTELGSGVYDHKYCENSNSADCQAARLAAKKWPQKNIAATHSKASKNTEKK
jgi:hypothetical protein